MRPPNDSESRVFFSDEGCVFSESVSPSLRGLFSRSPRVVFSSPRASFRSPRIVFSESRVAGPRIVFSESEGVFSESRTLLCSPRVCFWSVVQGRFLGVRGLFSRVRGVVFSESRVVFSESEKLSSGVRQSEGCFSESEGCSGVEGLSERGLSSRTCFSRVRSVECANGVRLKIRSPTEGSLGVEVPESPIFLPGVRSVGGRTGGVETLG